MSNLLIKNISSEKSNKSMVVDDFLKALSEADSGYMKFTTPEGDVLFFGEEGQKPECDIKLNTWDVVKNLLSKGDVAFFEDYLDNAWETDDLESLLTFATLNSEIFENFFYGKFIYRVISFFKHFKNPNTKKGSKKNISAHYDLSNRFYSLWLDDSMTYSSAIFKNAEEDLLQAQTNKYQRIFENSVRDNNDNILEIGCGWGGFADYAANQSHKVSGITISENQHKYALNRMKQKGLDSHADIKLIDYRDIKQKYDAIVSIEMFEAVGREYWDTYFNKIKGLLVDGGNAVIQTITIANDKFEGYKKRGDFIQQYVFPGGMLPSDAEFEKATSSAGLKIADRFSFGKDYAKTLRLWLNNFDEVKAEVKDLGFDERFIKLWRYYLCYCIAGFESERTNVYQYKLSHI